MIKGVVRLEVSRAFLVALDGRVDEGSLRAFAQEVGKELYEKRTLGPEHELEFVRAVFANFENPLGQPVSPSR